MTVYRRNGTDLYSYDFRVDGVRYSGSTGASDEVSARSIEESIRAEISGLDAFCRSIIRKAKKSLPAMPSANRGYVYMLRSGYFIKIGHSLNPAERLKTISTSSPNECELLFCLLGSAALERRLHASFAPCHYQREWFFLCGKLKHFVTEFERHVAAQELLTIMRNVPPKCHAA